MIQKSNTKALFAVSLKELAKSKPADKITVKQITQNCGMTSPTFYNYFHDKYELMAWIYNQRIEEAMEHFGKTLSFKDIVHKFIEPLLEDEEFYQNLLKNAIGQNAFRYTTNDHAIRLVSDWIKKYHNISELPAEIQFYLRFYMRAMSETTNDWFLGKCSYSSQELTKLLVEAMPDKLKPLLLVDFTIR